MPTEIIVALIGLLGVLLAPLIQSAAAGRPAHRSLALAFFIIGMFLLVSATVRLGTPGDEDGTAVDLGSTWDARYSRFVSELDRESPFIFRHTPRGQFRYERIAVDGILVRVRRVCGFRAEDVTSLFTRENRGPTGPPIYASALLEVQVGCRMEFVVRPSGKETIGIELVAEAVGVLP